MLHSLHIRNLALIEHAEVRFGDGLNVISGETGGGKSLVISALKLLRGEKVAAGLVRNGADELQVDGEFQLGAGDRSQAVRERVREVAGALPDDDVLLVTRLVDVHGRSRARVGGRPVTLAALRSLGELLLEIHGQGDSRALMRPEIQSETLDAFAGTTNLRREFAAALAQARDVDQRVRELTASARDRRQRVDFLRFQLRELEELRLQPGEVERLEAEHQLLENLDTMRAELDATMAALQDGEGSALDQIGVAAKHLANAAAIDKRLEAAGEQLQAALEVIAEVARQVQSGQARLELDPMRLDEVRERLDAIMRLLQRHGPTERELRDNQRRLERELGALQGGDQDPEALAALHRQRLDAAAATGRKLLRARHKAAAPFCTAIARELADLGMPHTQIRVAMADDFAIEALLERATAHGPVPVDLEVRINPGEPFHALRETASGGELARVVLAIKKTLADQDRVPLLVLDEIDAEIGGRLGLQVGSKLSVVAQHHQVVIVTHLPQVAAFAQRHFLVGKSVDGKGRSERTRAQIAALDQAGSERELAAMASGDPGDAAALEQARGLVRKARRQLEHGA